MLPFLIGLWESRPELRAVHCFSIPLAGPADVPPVLRSLTVHGKKATEAPLSYSSVSVSCPALTDVPLSLGGVVQLQVGSQQRKIARWGWVSLSHTLGRRCLSHVAVGS